MLATANIGTLFGILPGYWIQHNTHHTKLGALGVLDARERSRDGRPTDGDIGLSRLILHSAPSRKYSLALGGDHTMTYPILRAMAKKHGPVALIHVDAHADINDDMFGEKIAHGTPFRRALEDGCLQADKVFQIGLRGTGYSPEDFNWSRKQGFTVVPAEDCWYKSLVPLMTEVREKIGDHPVYLSYDIDSLDPAFAPGTGTVEIGGLTIWQAPEIIRGCQGLNVVGGDLVEVSPPYDPSGNTALVGANLLYEMLCILPGVRYSADD